MIDDLIKVLQKKVDDYSAFKEIERQKAEKEAEKKRLELQKKIDDEAEKAGVQSVELPETVHSPQISRVKTESGSAKIQKKWVYEIVDEAKIPKKYLMPNHKALKEAVEKGGIRKIAGVKITQKTGTRITSR